MRTFNCPRCSTVVFFENDQCLTCGAVLIYDPKERRFVEPGPGTVMLCANGRDHGVCNWAASPGSDRCLACSPNVEIPDLSVTGNRERWLEIERAKRRVFYTLLDLEQRPFVDADAPLRFSFIASVGDRSATTGHNEGHITLDIAEAEEPERARRQHELGEDYRTVLGHLRHEFGHYFWPHLLPDDSSRAEFRRLFGDETADYAAALERHYDGGPLPNWRSNFISAYATAHPHEDWAECFAHYLHIADTFDTAMDLHLTGPRADDFGTVLDDWCELTIKLNQLGRSMGFRDLYPFVIAQPVREKLTFVHDRLTAARAQNGFGSEGRLLASEGGPG